MISRNDPLGRGYIHALPRQPFIGLALAVSSGILAADFAPDDCSSVTWTALAVLAIIALLSRKSFAVYAFVSASFFVLHSLRTTDLPYAQLIRDLGNEPRPVTVHGTVVREPKMAPSGIASFFLEAESIEIDGVERPCHVTFLARWRASVELGDEVRLFGTAEPIGFPRNPGEFDLRAFLKRQGIQRSLVVRYAENGIMLSRGHGNRIIRAAQKSRDWMQATLSRNLENSPDVTGAINGMVLGLRHQTEEDIEEPFQQTGTLHLFAVAGLHVGIVARLLWIVMTVLRLPRRTATALIIPALLFYSAVTGLHISSVRAAVMSSALLTGFFAERRMFPLNNLSAAATLILCWNTNELFSVGFQLSFCVVAAIVMLADPTCRLIQRVFAPDPLLPRSLFGTRQLIILHATTWLARAASVSFAAWIGSLPLMIGLYYSLITPVSLIANLVVVPIAFFVLAGGLISMVTAPLSVWLSVIFNNANWLLTKVILGSVYLFAQLPAGHAYVAPPHWPTKPNIEITLFDLQSGAAAHVRTPTSDWLIDTGSLRDYQRVVRQYLRSRGVDKLDGLILTHGDGAHIGGASRLLLDFNPSTMIDSTVPDRSPIHRRFISELARKHQVRKLCAAGDEFDLSPEVRARVLFPPRGIGGGRADDQALVIGLDFGKHRVLLMSDSGVATERFLLRQGADLRTDLLVKGQHYSGVSGSEEFLDATQAQTVIASSCDFPEFERIKDEWMETVRRRGIKLLRQDETGAVQLRFFADHWEAKSYVTAETFRSTR